uniref:DEAD/DEAH box helicase n=1 Tax=Bursaphelenchus xylophilus TaxID=6326 RepID=A0A1I7SIU0_BURXY
WDLIIIFGNLRNEWQFTLFDQAASRIRLQIDMEMKKVHGQYEAVIIKYIFDHQDYLHPIWKFLEDSPPIVWKKKMKKSQKIEKAKKKEKKGKKRKKAKKRRK